MEQNQQLWRLGGPERFECRMCRLQIPNNPHAGLQIRLGGVEGRSKYFPAPPGIEGRSKYFQADPPQPYLQPEIP